MAKAKNWVYRTTNYQDAWNNYRKSDIYADAVKILKEKGMKQPYSLHFLESTFSAAWRASGVKTRFLKKAEKNP